MTVYVWVTQEARSGITVHTTKEHAVQGWNRLYALRMKAGLCRWRLLEPGRWALEDDDLGRFVTVAQTALLGPLP